MQQARHTQALRIVDVVAESLGLPPGVILGHQRAKAVAEARALAYLLLAEAGMRWTEIAEIFDRDHSTIIHRVGRLRAILRASASREAVARVIAQRAGVHIGNKCLECGRPLEGEQAA